MKEVAFGLGSNVGDKQDNLERALALLFAGREVEFLAASSFWRSEPWGFTDQDWFLNLCAVGRTALSPGELLEHAQSVERQVGRRQTFRWGPRVIDVDILYLGDTRIDRPELHVPHKEMFNRGFVLVPLAEIRPDLVIGGRAVSEAARAAGAGLERAAPPWAPRR